MTIGHLLGHRVVARGWRVVSRGKWQMSSTMALPFCTLFILRMRILQALEPRLTRSYQVSGVQCHPNDY